MGANKERFRNMCIYLAAGLEQYATNLERSKVEGKKNQYYGSDKWYDKEEDAIHSWLLEAEENAV